MAWTRKQYDKFKIEPPNTTFNNPVAPVNAPDMRIAPPVVVGAPPDTINVPQYQQMIPDVPLAQPPPAQVIPPVNTPLPPTNPMVVAPAAPIIEREPTLKDRVNTIHNKDYSIRKDENGNIIHRGKDRDKNWTTLDKVGSALIGLWEGGIPGAIQAATDRNFMEKLGDQNQLSRLYPQVEQARKQEDFEMGQKVKTAQIDNIEEDNRRMRDDMTRKAETDRQKAMDRAKLKIVGLKRFDPTDPVHKDLATTAGLDPETLKGWDDRNPIFKEVAGKTFEYNRTTGAFEQSGLPEDESKALTDYKVEMPNGETRTYRVSNKDAANFATQMHALGARLEQQESQFSRSLAQRNEQFKQQFSLAQQRLKQTAENFRLQKEKFDYAKSRGEAVDERQMDALKLNIGKARNAINADITLDASEKQMLLDELPDID